MRLDKFDCLVGINLLREGLDIPEITLVAILDADKEGFLRSETSLIQTIGRAARNSEGHVIMERKEVNEGTAKDLIRKTDKERRVYYKTYTGKEWGISSSYDLTLNSSTLSRAAIIDILKYLYNNEMNG